MVYRALDWTLEHSVAPAVVSDGVRRLEQLQRQARDLLNENSPLLTPVHRKSLYAIAKLTASQRNLESALTYWTERLRIIRYKIIPGAAALENDLTAAAKSAQAAKSAVPDIWDPKRRAQMVAQVEAARAALAKAAERLASGDWPLPPRDDRAVSR
jgi:hypothetical protein